MREKRSALVQSKVFPTTKERVKRRLKELDNVTSISDYLFLLVERDLLDAENVAIVKQKIGGRLGRN